MAERITPEKLKSLFIDTIRKSKNFTFLDGIQPFLITYSGKPYYVYIKHLSSAFFKDRPDTTRAQLPIRSDFEEIKKSSIPFVFLGYDFLNDVYVCWNYHIAKNRLNEKESVSFYSRESFQREVTAGTFLRKRLKNDDIPVYFKRTDLVSFFENIESFFNDNNELGLFNMEESKSYERDGKIFKITEPDLLEKIHAVVNDEIMNILDGISIAKKYYGNKYPNMRYSDWSNLIKSTKQEGLPEKEISSSLKDLMRNPEFKIELGEKPDRVIAEKFGCSVTDVYLARRSLGIESFGRMENCKTPKDINEILKDYKELGSLQKVAEKYGCTKQALSLRLKKENIELQRGRKSSTLPISENLVFESNKKYAITIMDYLFGCKIITKEMVEFLCNKSQMNTLLGVAIPCSILLKLDSSRDLKSQVFISGQSRYYTDHIYDYDGEKYVVSSQWYGPETTKTDTKTPFINWVINKIK